MAPFGGSGRLVFQIFHFQSVLNKTYLTHPVANQILPVAAWKTFPHVHLLLSMPTTESSYWQTQHYSHFGYCGHGTQCHGCQEPRCWRSPKAEQENDNKVDWSDKRWTAKQCKLPTQFLTACLVSPVVRAFRSGIHFLKFSSFFTFWKIFPESLGSLQALGGASGCRSGGQVAAFPPGGRNHSSKKTDFTERGGERGNEQKNWKCVS